MVVDKDVRVVYDGDDCRCWCVLKEVLGVQLSMGGGADSGGCGWKDVGMVATQ